MDLRQQILDAAAGLFQTEGVNFTMQQVAASLHISKKTIYTVYPDKEALLMEMVDMLFEKIHRRNAELAALPEPLEVRLQAMIIALPEEYAAMDFRQLDALEERYPAVAARVRRHLETGWEPTLALLEETRQAGLLRDVPFDILRTMITGSIEAFLRDESLTAQEYANALETMIDIFLEGVLER